MNVLHDYRPILQHMILCINVFSIPQHMKKMHQLCKNSQFTSKTENIPRPRLAVYVQYTQERIFLCNITPEQNTLWQESNQYYMADESPVKMQSDIVSGLTSNLAASIFTRSYDERPRCLHVTVVPCSLSIPASVKTCVRLTRGLLASYPYHHLVPPVFQGFGTSTGPAGGCTAGREHVLKHIEAGARWPTLYQTNFSSVFPRMKSSEF